MGGANYKDFKDKVNSDLIQTYNNSKELTICKHNTLYFKRDEPVEITVEIKNISNLIIKVRMRRGGGRLIMVR